MEEEIILRQKYRRLYKNTISIKNKVEELERLLDDAQSAMKESLLVDNKMVEEEQFRNVKEEVSAISLELTNEVLLTIRNYC